MSDSISVRQRTEIVPIVPRVVRRHPSLAARGLHLERAKLLLKSSELGIGEVGIRVGFESASHSTRAFRRAAGIAPSAYRRSLER